jgi:hypothetical protein
MFYCKFKFELKKKWFKKKIKFKKRTLIELCNKINVIRDFIFFQIITVKKLFFFKKKIKKIQKKINFSNFKKKKIKLNTIKTFKKIYNINFFIKKWAKNYYTMMKFFKTEKKIIKKKKKSYYNNIIRIKIEKNQKRKYIRKQRRLLWEKRFDRWIKKKNENQKNTNFFWLYYQNINFSDPIYHKNIKINKIFPNNEDNELDFETNKPFFNIHPNQENEDDFFVNNPTVYDTFDYIKYFIKENFDEIEPFNKINDLINHITFNRKKKLWKDLIRKKTIVQLYKDAMFFNMKSNWDEKKDSNLFTFQIIFSILKRVETDYSTLKKWQKYTSKKKNKIKFYFKYKKKKNIFKKNNNYYQLYNFFIKKKNSTFFYKNFEFNKVINSFNFFSFYTKKEKIIFEKDNEKNFFFFWNL